MDTQVFDQQEAAKYLKVSRDFLAAARRNGTGPAFSKLGRCVRYRKEALDTYLAANEQGGTK
jgi:excisionase family DNA binding protein